MAGRTFQRAFIACLATGPLGLPLPATAQTVSIGSLAVSGDDRSRATQCLALAIAYEAGYETQAGQQAVGEVILNRVRDPVYPKSVCGVVFQGSARRTGCQFTFTCDGALRRRLPAAVVEGSHAVAERLIAGSFTPLVGGATHYHASYVSPYWAPTLRRVRKIGAHIFYRAPAALPNPAQYIAAAEPAIDQLGSGLQAIDPVTQGKRRATAAPETSETPPLPDAPAESRVFTLWGLSAAAGPQQGAKP